MNEATGGRADLIRQCYLFEGAKPETIARLAETSTLETRDRRMDVFYAGDASDGMRILISGTVRIWINDVQGRELTLALIEPGEAFGEIAMLDGASRTANASVLETARMLLVKQAAFDAVLETDPRLARHLIVLLCDRLRRNTSDLRGFAFQDMGARLAAKLHDLAMGHAEIDGDEARFTAKFSQTELANMLGVTREAVNKRLAAMSCDGILSMEDGKITIRSLAALRLRSSSD
ncbi:Crp/Fnr family transcriptional regulator [Palleronia pelagia]|uniref:cAMP-binding domain of CRP or a regulatory subunit of cAMP-dependent protein kinases n=1 Tax=Palleronia pelagia TaxID=387096 RepID=A0A1H8AJX5_9RHOB|nr:Crp/Fnr family transcriptional regulator [Palleronia pelagia]SEM70786.1 cAMP-binding domain of CRP or a regulatory subunit of cAMP-dependent protein kinases [Palleronia pelagia]